MKLSVAAHCLVAFAADMPHTAWLPCIVHIPWNVVNLATVNAEDITAQFLLEPAQCAMSQLQSRQLKAN